MTRMILAATAASLLIVAGVGAQEGEVAEPTTYVLADDGSATHNATGAVCPSTIGDLVLAQVMSFDQESEHLGIGCQYANEAGFTAAISVLRSDQPELVGVGAAPARWNRSIYQLLNAYPTALPKNVAGLEGDEAAGLYGALFTADGGGLPLRLGVWQTDDGEWQYRAQATFVPLSAETEWALAEQTRAALLAAKAGSN